MWGLTKGIMIPMVSTIDHHYHRPTLLNGVSALLTDRDGGGGMLVGRWIVEPGWGFHYTLVSTRVDYGFSGDGMNLMIRGLSTTATVTTAVQKLSP